jgi:ATP-dependent Clp protease ATP-binding subunit ClpC
MFERFTDRARRVVVLAQDEARLLDHNYIGTEHLLLGLLQEGQGVAARALEALGVDLTDVRSRVQEIIGRGQHEQTGHIPFTPRAKTVLELSLREALDLGHEYIGTEHILLGLVREGEGVAAQVLVALGAGEDQVREKVTELVGRPSPRPAEQPAEQPGGTRVTGSALPVHEIVTRLDAIDRRLAAIERHLGTGETGAAAAQE